MRIWLLFNAIFDHHLAGVIVHFDSNVAIDFNGTFAKFTYLGQCTYCTLV